MEGFLWLQWLDSWAMPAPANDWIPSGFGTGYEHRREDEDRRGRR
jgi:hypothetical protein